MNAIDLKDEVQKALAQEWPEFASAHPRLAAALDETLLVEPAMQSLGDDPEFQAAMETASAVGAGADAAAALVAKLVGKWLQALV